LSSEVFIEVGDHGTPCLEHSGEVRQIGRREQQALPCEILQEEELQEHRGRTQRRQGPIQQILAKAFYFLQEVFL
jgi:hypothetical protein